MNICKIVYVRHAGESGWRWRSLDEPGKAQTSAKTYALYYECVLAARAKGFHPSPALKCA
jgi:hypothetical protein